jgi:hypothetical protein
MPKMIIFLDAPSFWQTRFEETTIFTNKHSSFIFIVSMFILLWFFICTFYYFVLCGNRDKFFVHYKELEIIWTWLALFLIALPLPLLWEFDISTTALDPDFSPDDSPVDMLLRDVERPSFTNFILYRTFDEFWELEYGQKRYCLQRYF